MFGPKVALLGGNVIVLEKGGISWGECVLFGSQRCTLGGKSVLSGRKCPSLGRTCHSAACGVAVFLREKGRYLSEKCSFWERVA